MLPYCIVYPIILCLSSFQYNKRYVFRILAISLLIIFIGIRYDVGKDYPAYELMYYQYSEKTADGYILEPGYLFIYNLVYNYSGPFYWVTLITGFLQIIFLYWAIKDFKYYVFSLFLFLTFSGGYIFIVNGMRQGIAACIWLYSLKHISRSNLWLFSLCIILGGLFHYSLILMFPLYFLLRKVLPYKLYIAGFILAIILSKMHILSSLFLWIISLTPYSRYLEANSGLVGTASANTGLVFNFINIIGFLILWNYKRLISTYPHHVVYFNLYFIFLVARNVFMDVQIFLRVLPYFSWVDIIIYPLAISCFFKNHNRTLVYIASGIIAIAVFVKVVYTKDYMISYQIIQKF